MFSDHVYNMHFSYAGHTNYVRNVRLQLLYKYPKCNHGLNCTMIPCHDTRSYVYQMSLTQCLFPACKTFMLLQHVFLYAMVTIDVVVCMTIHGAIQLHSRLH